MTAIALSGVALSLGRTTILSDVSLAIEEGEFIGVLGPNGSGKTTLLKSILGLVPVTSGAIRVLDGPVRRGNPAIGYMPQSRAALPALRLTGRDFLAASIHGERWGVPRIGPHERRELDQALEFVDGLSLAGRPLADMSGGERQRLLLAGALIGTPRILLLDEPLISLDPHQQHVVVDLVRGLSRRLGLTVLFTAHELNQLLGAIDRVLYLGRGRAALGAVDQVITPEILSALYGAPIEVVRAGGRIFVMSGGHVVERDAHNHGHSH
ncbi:MAG: ATP-binding cassette domain-containing protein [Bauldia sp.]